MSWCHLESYFVFIIRNPAKRPTHLISHVPVVGDVASVPVHAVVVKVLDEVQETATHVQNQFGPETLDNEECGEA